MNSWCARSRKLMVTLTAVAGLAAAPALAADSFRWTEGSPTPTISLIDMYVAQDAGFLKAENLDGGIDFAPNGAVATQVVANGQGDVGDVTMEAYLTGYDKGMRGKFVATRSNLNIYFLAIPANSPAKTIKDLEGKKIGVLSMGSLALPYFKSMARAAGMNPDADMFLPVGYGDSAIAALKSGQVQALGLNLIGYAGLVRAGQEFRYIFHPTLANAGNYGFFVSDQNLAKKRSAVVGFIRAMIKTDIFVQENPAAALAIFWKRHPEQRPQGDAVRLGTIELTYNPAEGGARAGRMFPPNRAALETLVTSMRKEGMITESNKITVNDLIDESVFADASKGIDVEAIKKIARDWK